MPKKILNTFFVASIIESSKKQRITLTELSELYIAELMVKLSVEGSSFYNPKQRLADIYMEALLAETKYEKTNKLKDIGDMSVLKLGFFPESINSIISPSYYRDMGIMAYGSVYEDEKKQVYKDMHDLYDDCVNVIHGVRSYPIKDDMLKLYDMWKATNSKFAKARLIELGFFPDKDAES